MSANFYELLKYAATGIASPDMTYYDRMRASTLMGGATVQTLTGIPPLSFKADGTPLISWSMKGNGQQTGTPTPDNPVMPEFVGVRSANLAPPLTEWIDGYVASNGDIAAPNIVLREKSSDYISVKAGSAYTLSIENGFPSGTDIPWRAIGWYAQDKTFISIASGNSGNALSTNAPSNAVYCRLSYRTYGKKTNPMLNAGSTALPYEPFGYKIPITCGGETTPVYLCEVPTVRKIRKYIFTGEENITDIGEYYNTNVSVSSRAWGITVSTTGGFQISNGGNRIWVRKTHFSDYTTPDAFKTYLQQQYAAGTPVTVWYVLAEPETGIVNEPLCKIGDYADELHSTDAAVTIPTAKGQNVLTVDTPIQPSEMTITFKG